MLSIHTGDSVYTSLSLISKKILSQTSEIAHEKSATHHLAEKVKKGVVERSRPAQTRVSTLACQPSSPVAGVNERMQERLFCHLEWNRESYMGICGRCIAEFPCAPAAMLEGIVEYGEGNA